ncbi:zinc finger protein [Trichuris trichiura]|uniref:Zinc finger protein n=1 Tax=Trichuris trichiura TaxID=36087 RepID=A0A077ZBM3_TRITR|nr:zinc finger protein [Trichuris trichiura]
MDVPLWLLCDEGVNIVGMDTNLDPIMTVQIRNDASVAVFAPSSEPSISRPLFDLQSENGIEFHQIEDAMLTCLAGRSHDDIIMEHVQRLEVILSDLTAIGWERVHKLSANLTDVVLKITDSDRRCHFMNLHYTLNWPVEFTCDVDLPASLEINWKQKAPAVFEAFVNHVDACRDLWNQLKAIDTFACVIDPKQPKFCDVKRQLFLAENASMIVTLNPSEPRALPDIQFIGPESQLKRYHDLVNRNLIYWDKSNGVLENLQKLLDGALPELDSCDEVELENAWNTSLDCLICQCDVDSDGRIADLFCDSCHSAYHAACIRKWVRRHPQRVISFGFVMGPCPHCSKMIKVSARA